MKLTVVRPSNYIRPPLDDWLKDKNVPFGAKIDMRIHESRIGETKKAAYLRSFLFVVFVTMLRFRPLLSHLDRQNYNIIV